MSLDASHHRADLHRHLLRNSDTSLDLRQGLLGHDLRQDLIRSWFDTLSENGPWWTTSMYLVHYSDVIWGTIASQITSLTFVYSTVYWSADQRKHQSSASLAFVWGIHRGPGTTYPHKGPVTRKMCPFDDVIMGRRPRNSQNYHTGKTKYPRLSDEANMFCKIFKNLHPLLDGNVQNA